jgi:hypothetical protein
MVNNNSKGYAMLRRLVGGLYMVNNATRWFVDDVKVNNYGRLTYPLYTILMH